MQGKVPCENACMDKLTYDTTTGYTTVWVRGRRGKWRGLWQPLFRIQGRAAA